MQVEFVKRQRSGSFVGVIVEQSADQLCSHSSETTSASTCVLSDRSSHCCSVRFLHYRAAKKRKKIATQSTDERVTFQLARLVTDLI